MTHSLNIINRAKHLRKEGYSYEEIGKKFNVSKSTAFHWTREIILDENAKERIRSRERRGLKKAQLIRKEKRDLIVNSIKKDINQFLLKIKLGNSLNKLLCAILYWAKGAKINSNNITFVNSDPVMIKSFLKMFRTGFKVDESKFRCLVHIHEYHNDNEIKKYWSGLTKIPLSQFNKSYKKIHTGKRKRDNYMGCLQLRYYDWRVALEMRLLYNMFAQLVISQKGT